MLQIIAAWQTISIYLPLYRSIQFRNRYSSDLVYYARKQLRQRQWATAFVQNAQRNAREKMQNLLKMQSQMNFQIQ